MDEISSIAEDYVKAIWSATEWDGPAITTKALAERFGTTSATASDTVKRLAAQGLLEHEPYKAIALTPLGERHALAMVRRHRLIETFLVSCLGYGWAEVHNEAERLEHAVSDLMIERIDTQLGHPRQDPHGDPIPTAEGRVERPAGAVSLRRAPTGRYRVVRISDADSERLVYFHEHGIVPDAVVTVTAQDRHAHTVRLVVGGTGADGAANAGGTASAGGAANAGGAAGATGTADAAAELALAGAATDAVILAPA